MYLKLCQHPAETGHSSHLASEPSRLAARDQISLPCSHSIFICEETATAAEKGKRNKKRAFVLSDTARGEDMRK